MSVEQGRAGPVSTHHEEVFKLAPAHNVDVLCRKDVLAALLTLQHHRHDAAEQGAHLWGWETWTTEVLKGAPHASTMLPPAATKMTVSLFTKGSL